MTYVLKTIALTTALTAAASSAYAVDTNTVWSGLVNQATQQDWKFEHSCYAANVKVPYCSSTLTSPANAEGKSLLMVERLDMNQKLLARLLCEYSADYPNVRTCLDVDANIAIKEMFDDNFKVWKQVAERKLTAAQTEQEAAAFTLETLPAAPAPKPDPEPAPAPTPAPAPVVVAPPPPPPPAPAMTLVRTWDERQKSGTVIRRTLFSKADGSMHLDAVEYDMTGQALGGSSCDFNRFGENDCVNNNGVHYPLKPQSITWFYSMRPTASCTPTSSDGWLALRNAPRGRQFGVVTNGTPLHVEAVDHVSDPHGSWALVTTGNGLRGWLFLNYVVCK